MRSPSGGAEIHARESAQYHYVSIDNNKELPLQPMEIAPSNSNNVLHDINVVASTSLHMYIQVPYGDMVDLDCYGFSFPFCFVIFWTF